MLLFYYFVTLPLLPPPTLSTPYFHSNSQISFIFGDARLGQTALHVCSLRFETCFHLHPETTPSAAVLRTRDTFYRNVWLRPSQITRSSSLHFLQTVLLSLAGERGTVEPTPQQLDSSFLFVCYQLHCRSFSSWRFNGATLFFNRE